MSSSPIPGYREQPSALATPARGPLNLGKPRVLADQFRSPDNTADDNWDDDFASAISPTALQLPHLRPHDNFGGMLSSEKLKAYASFETVTEEANWDDNFEGDLTVKSPLQLTKSDPLQTIRPFYPKRADTEQIQHTAPTKSPEPKSPPFAGHRAKVTTNPNTRESFAKSTAAPPIMSYGEHPAKGDSDLVVENDTAADRIQSIRKVMHRISLGRKTWRC